jgi:hypothetical protein
MPANVRSLETIETVRAALVSFREELEQALAMIDLEMRRVLDWLEHDRPGYWRRAVRIANDDVTQARAALHRCLMYPINDERPSCYEERAELKKAEVRLAYCDEKSERLRHWVREVRHEMFEYEGRISQMVELVEFDVPRAVAILDRLLTRLEEYQSVRHSTAAHDGLAASAASSPATDPESMARELMPDQSAAPVPDPQTTATAKHSPEDAP